MHFGALEVGKQLTVFTSPYSLLETKAVATRISKLSFIEIGIPHKSIVRPKNVPRKSTTTENKGFA